MIKERYDVIASSLGSYFGVGFNTPEQQLNYDLGLDEAEFTDEAQDRMDLGTILENSVLDYFEKKLMITITDRNSEIIWAFDKKLKGKVDGMTMLDGVETGVECKVSNSQNKKFTEDKGYYLQCQAYMEAKNVDQWLLLGLQNGKPIYKLIKRDAHVISLIKIVVEFLYDVFGGLADPKDFPYHVTQEYNTQPVLEEIKIDDDDILLLEELKELKAASKQHDARIDELETYFKETFKNVKVEGKDFVATISTSKRAGGFDIDKLKEDYPLLDESKYKKPDSEFTQIRFSKRKG